MLLAGSAEVVGAILLKKVADKGGWPMYILLFGGFMISLSLLRLALEEIPLSIAYAVWTGIGSVGATLVGTLLYKESKSPLQLVCIAGIICTIIGLRLIG